MSMVELPLVIGRNTNARAERSTRRDAYAPRPQGAYNSEPLERPAPGNVLVCCSQPSADITLDL
jgi:hypothetical protein